MPRIAIVEDSQLERHFVATCLRSAGYTVDPIEPTSLAVIVGRLANHPPDLLLLDYSTPACSGDIVARACRNTPELQDLRILVYTAHPLEPMLPKFHDMQVEGFLQKPCSPRFLVDLAGKIIGGRAHAC